MNKCPKCDTILQLSTGNPDLACVNRKCNFVGKPINGGPFLLVSTILLIFIIFITFLYDVGILWQN
jgi:hypothetical protein